MLRRLHTDTRGLTEVLAYAILFSALILSIIVVYTNGMGALLEIKYGVQSNAGQQVMDTAAADAEEVYEQETPREAVEMQLRRVSLGTQSGTEITYKFKDVTTGDSKNFTYKTKTLVYSPESKFVFRVPNTRFTLTSGGLIRQDDDEAVMIREPPYQFTKSGTYITGVELNGTAGAGGTTHATVVFEQLRNNLKYRKSTTGRDIKVVIHIETSETKAKAWNRYFQDEGLTPTSRNDVKSGVVEYQYRTQHVSYKHAVLDVEVRN